MSDPAAPPPPPLTPSSEADVLLRYLRSARAGLLSKLDGLSEHDARRPLTATGSNLLGLVQHVGAVQQEYATVPFGRQPAHPLPFPEEDPDDPETWDGDLWVRASTTRAEVLALWDASERALDAAVAELGLDAPGHVPWWGDRGDTTLRTLLVHLVAEVARHAGHADVLREQLDGLDGPLGMRPGSSNLPERDADGWQRRHARVAAAAAEAARAAGEDA